ncbi:C-glycoside deglycosidase beta subunit domain-containing protein [Pelagibacterium halotolerans]|uniref:C-deglycosylation enzyme beta subunit n=1 Tax=Pelagibacterium halotolerans (strain DSM 22347 / JCM 15775 / CGMCC 1.7692 / B2) TaxID=1082931 RepID=G4R7E8_PELHB|nr:DUF6379 domain-containing protein [Pelagibacterium halotolerans]AEQ51286.1 hypothetical protein KKY_1260 [Pelagibacterium halotolerans B2]QJR18857.1 flagellar biosynthesis protein [Pelagibacterium halotolerans]SEA66422.1 hypothetical protein SAMN05428936_10633 [Pelagibacterium halotolerans]
MTVNRIIETGSLRRTETGFAMGIRLPWYRSLPLSVVELDALRLNGKSVPAESIAIEVDGTPYPVTDLGHLTDKNWFVADTATLVVQDMPIDADTEHDVEAVLSIYPPYLPNFRRKVRRTERMKAER